MIAEFHPLSMSFKQDQVSRLAFGEYRQLIIIYVNIVQNKVLRYHRNVVCLLENIPMNFSVFYPHYIQQSRFEARMKTNEEINDQIFQEEILFKHKMNRRLVLFLLHLSKVIKACRSKV